MLGRRRDPVKWPLMILITAIHLHEHPHEQEHEHEHEPPAGDGLGSPGML